MVMPFTEVISAGPTSQPFLMISVFCFLRMILFNPDPFTFSTPEMIALINLFLHGKKSRSAI
jgi:hypothetical protein